MHWKNTVQAMLRMNKAAWHALIVSLLLSCIFLITAIGFLFAFQDSGESASLILSRCFQEYAQLSLLIGCFLPVLLQDHLGPDP